MSYFDLMFFVLEYARKHGHENTCLVIEQYVMWPDAARIRNVSEDKYEALAEELVRRY